MDKAKQFFQNEYADSKYEPLSTELNGKNYIIPRAYLAQTSDKNLARELFLDDFFDAQQKDLSLYEKNEIEPKEIVWSDGKTSYTFFVPYKLKDKNLSNSEIITAIFKKAEEKYKQAASLSEKLKKTCPDSKKSYGVSKTDITSMRKQYATYLWNKTKDKTKYGALLLGNFVLGGVKTGAHKVAELTPNKFKKIAKHYALATLIGGAVIGGGYEFTQTNSSRPSDKIENVGDVNAIKKQNAQVFDESLNEIKTVLCFMENFANTTFLDGKGVPTIGYGCTYFLDENGRGNRDISPVTKGTQMTMEEADLQKERYLMYRVKNQILEDVKVPLDKEHIIATTSFMYVIGPSAFKKSEYLKAMNRGVQGEELARYMLGFAKDKGVVKRNWFAAQIMSGKLKPVDFLDLRAEGCYTLEMEDCCKMNGERVWRDENGLGIFLSDNFDENILKAQKKRSSVIGSCKIVRDILPKDVVLSVEKNMQKLNPSRNLNYAFLQKKNARGS